MRWCSRVAVVGLTLSLIALAACKKEGELPPEFGPRGPAVDVAKLQAPALFAHIPADAPYVFASFEAVPLPYYAKIRRALGPALLRSLDQLRSRAPDGGEAGRWLEAVIDELDGKWSAAGLESLGLSARPRFAIYGHGALPVVARVEIKDGKALLATIERIAQRAGARLPPLENRHGREFWRLELPGEAGAIVAITGDQLVAAYGPRPAIAAVLPQILGAEQPSRNMAGGDELKRLIARHRLGPLLIGYVDARRLASGVLALAEHAPPAACTAAIDRIAAQVPRLVVSYTELTDKRFSGAAVVELAPPLAEELKALRAAVPGLRAVLEGEPLLAAGGGIDLARGREAGKAVAATLRDLGIACDAQELVRAARELRDAMTEPIPAPLAKLAGAAIAIDSIDFGDGGGKGGGAERGVPRAVEGIAMAAVPDVRSAFASLEDNLPVSVSADGKLHPIPLAKLGVPFDLHGGVGEQAIVVAAGARGKQQAEKVLAASAGDKAPFLAAKIDVTKLLELQRRLDPSARRDLADLDGAMAALFGQMTLRIDATDAGLALWMAGELK